VLSYHIFGQIGIFGVLGGKQVDVYDGLGPDGSPVVMNMEIVAKDTKVKRQKKIKNGIAKKLKS
jgi:hypothetical protein